MRKILISVIILLLMALSFIAIAKGINVSIIRIPSVESIKLASENLDSSIDEGNRITSITFPQKLAELDAKYKELQKAKQEYEDMLVYSTSEEVKSAKTSQVYDIEFIWIKLGGYAKEEGIQAKFELIESRTPDLQDIKFTVDGRYSQIIEFLYDVENDSKLDFKIEEFSIAGSGKTIQAEFIVRDLKVTY